MAGIPVKLSAQRGDTSGTPTIHRFRVDSWDTLKGHIGRIFDPMDDVTVKYHDDAGDAVVLSNQEEWDECLQINSGENTNPLCLFAELAPPGLSERSRSFELLSSPAAKKPECSAKGTRLDIAKEGHPGKTRHGDEDKGQPSSKTPPADLPSKETEEAAVNRLIADVLMGGHEKWRRRMAGSIFAAKDSLADFITLKATSALCLSGVSFFICIRGFAHLENITNKITYPNSLMQIHGDVTVMKVCIVISAAWPCVAAFTHAIGILEHCLVASGHEESRSVEGQ
jgi:hypothetical protein